MGLLEELGLEKRLNISQTLTSLIDDAALFGLPARDIAHAKEMLEYNEYGCAFDIVLVQLHECSIPITERYYWQIETIAKAMSIPVEQYSFAKELAK